MIHNPPPDRRRVIMAMAWACVMVGVGMLAVLSQQVERTSDEVNYLLAGRTLVARQPLATEEQRYQGPLILLGTQITDDHGRRATEPGTLQRARLGMLVFPALLLAILVLWSRSVMGERAALLTAFLAVTNPTLLAYGPLLSSDVPFAAMSLTAAWLLWRWLGSSRLRDLVLVGVSFGALAATKYTSLLICAVFVVVVVFASIRGFDATPPGCSRRAGGLAGRVCRAGLALIAIAAVALPTLHACYLFASPPFPSSSAGSLQFAPWRLLAALPFGPQLLGLLPEPLVLGVDFQTMIVGQTQNGTFFDRVGNHWAYYPVSLLSKTPVATLGLALLAALWLCRRRPGMRFFWICVLVPPVILLLYCSATRALQMGVRYVLPMVPALLLLGGSWVLHPWYATRLGRCLTALVLASSLLVVGVGWPNYIGYFNALVGGPVGGYRVCFDGNCDWVQRYGPGRTALQLRHPGAAVLRAGEGPRFGLLCAYTADLKVRDHEDPTHTYHWLTRFEPIDHDFAAWLVFDVTPEAFEQCIAAGDGRAAHDLAIAWLRQRDFAAARRALARVPAGEAQYEPRSRCVAHLIDLLQVVEQGGESERAVAVERFAAAGHADIALSLLTNPRREDAVRVFLLMLSSGHVIDAVERLDRVGADGSRTLEEAFLLATAVYEGARDLASDPRRAQLLMQRGPVPEAGSPLLPLWTELRRKVERAMAWINTTEDDR